MPVGFQLIKSVVSSIQVYWSSVFILPKSVTQEIEKLMREFLWSHGDLKKGSAKVKWADVCCQKNYGGLGIKPLHTWNIALMSKHVWNIVSGKDSLWVKWVSAYRLKDRRTNRNFWDVPELNDVSWSWRKILQYRDLLRDHIIHRLGDGTLTSAWFDNWIFIGPLCKFISKRDIYEAGFSLTCKVADVIQNGVWKWPANWYVKFPFLAHLPPPLLFRDRQDKVLWKSKNGKLGSFSVKGVWNDLSEIRNVVPWYNLVWFSQNIPRQSFILWLAINQRLKTQDRISKWQDIGDVKCSLCNDVQESHCHLFF